MEFKDRFQFLIDNKLVNNEPVTSYRIGKETSISRVSADNYLSGKQSPSIEKAIIIAQYFDVSISWLLIGEGDLEKKEESTANEKLVSVSSEAWEVIKKQSEIISRQSESIELKDQQINDLMSSLKKTNALEEENAKCAAASGSDLQG